MQLLYNNASPERSPLDLNDYLLQVAAQGTLSEHLVILPTHRKLRELERALTDEHFKRTGTPLTHLPLFTMPSFAQALYEKLAPGRREASMEIQIALMERAMKNVSLDYYARKNKPPSLGVVEQITRVISGVRADGVLPSQFAQDIQNAKEDPASYPNYDTVKLQDLYNIYSEYLRILGDTWIDYPGRMLRVNTELFRDRDTLFRKAFPGTRQLLIHDHTEFTQPESDMLIQLGMVRDLDLFLIFDYDDRNGPLYGNFQEVIGKLVTGGYSQANLDPLDPTLPEAERRPFPHHMRHNLFRTDERIENSAFDDRIAAYSFHTREEEVRGIAGLVKALVYEEKIAPERICVATLTLEHYTELFREHLPGYGVPANITARFRLEQNGLITALFSALSILGENYDRRDVLRAVTSPYLSFGPDVDPAALADASTRLRITRGYQSWRRRIGRRIEFLLTRIGTLADPDERRSVELELETLRRAEKSIVSVHNMLAEFSTRLRPQEFRAAFLRLIAKLHATENILQLRRNLERMPRTPADWQRVHDEMERDTRALARFMGLLNELTELFELDAEAERKKNEEKTRTKKEGSTTEDPADAAIQSELRAETDRADKSAEEPTDQDPQEIIDPPKPASAEENESESAEAVVEASTEDSEAIVHSLNYYLDHLRTAAARSYYSIREKHDYGILVTTLEQLQGLQFEVVIICGLVDGEFPSTYIPTNFLGKPLAQTQQRQLRRERVAFYNGLTASKQRLYLTYPRTAGNNDLVRSSFLDALLRITTLEENGRTVEYKELRIEREERRKALHHIPDRDFPALIETLEELAEEAGSALWRGEALPRVEEGVKMLENLQHTVAVEIGRHEAEENASLVPEYRGIIGSALTEPEQEGLAARRHKEYSASQLELYARCPFKYFTRRILSVDAPAHYDVTLTPLERGFLLHSVLFRLYTELRDKGELPITAENYDAALSRAREIAQQEIEGIALDHPYWKIDQERLLGSEALSGLLEQWIAGEAHRTGRKTELVPEFFEVGFGKSGSGGTSTDALLSQNREIELYEVKVRGKVDRVEILRRGDFVYYAVADYKTGQPPSRTDIEQGLSLQLMLYLEVIRHILADYFELPLENVKPAGGIYYRLNAREVDTKDTYLFVPNELKKDLIDERKYKRDPETIEDLENRMEEAFAYAEKYVEGISSGTYHVTTHDVNKVCRGCEYHSICRVWEIGRPEGN